MPNFYAIRKRTCFIIVLVLLTGFVFAEDEKPPEKPREKATAREFVTHHKIQIGAEILSYTAVAGDTIIKNSEEEQQATIFCISYIKEGVSHQEDRPITFLFNGGPGSSSVWLHLGAFGPRRIDLPEDPVNPGAPPYKLSDNPNTLLAFSDLVFVDPVGTGYSHALGKNKDKDYWGVDEDSAVLADFIRSYLTANKRWNSPKYLLGESYGTLRASVLIRDLELKLLDSVFFNGVVLVSSALDVRTFLNGGANNELPYVTNLPTYAATAYYHHALPEQPQDLDSFLRKVEQFAVSEYLPALFKGDTLPANEQQAIAEKLHQFTGLSSDFITRSHLRIDRDRFLKELLRSRGLTLGIHDTRFVGRDPDEAGEAVQNDPFLFGIPGPFVAIINSYLSGELGVKIQDPYVTFSIDASQSWKRAGGTNFAFAGFLNTVEYLAQAADTNKDFRVFAASGLYDLTTTYFGTQYVFDHSGIETKRVLLHTYVGGHMMYMHPASLKQLASDIGAFMK